MPELPEVETVRRGIESGVTGQLIAGVTLYDFPGVLECAIPGVDPIATLTGHAIEGTGRRGKYLFLHLDGELTLIVHLRMTGRLLLLPRAEPPVRFEHAAIHLENGLDLRFGDQRKFGRIIIATNDDLAALDQRLGPEPASSRLTALTLQTSLARRPGKIKNALLDQRLIAGLGNIYVDEALFRSRIHPERAANTLTIEETSRLLRAIRVVLNQATAKQGTTFSTFENPYGERGDNARFLRAYGRAGLPCLRCGHIMERIVVAGRGTTFCSHCQPLVKPE